MSDDKVLCMHTIPYLAPGNGDCVLCLRAELEGLRREVDQLQKQLEYTREERRMAWAEVEGLRTEVADRQVVCTHCGYIAVSQSAAAARALAEKLAGALRSIAEGNLGPAPWQADYERIREVASAALSAYREEGAGAPKHEHEFFTDEDGACWPCPCGEPFRDEAKR